MEKSGVGLSVARGLCQTALLEKKVLRDQGDDRYSQSFNHLSGKLRTVQNRAQLLQKEVQGLQETLKNQRYCGLCGCVKNFVGDFAVLYFIEFT